jgi:serine/threonine-protein kinase
MDNLSGTQLGKYLLVGRIARGGMSEVYRARDVTTQTEVAVKVMRAVVDSEDELSRLMRRFEQEARIVAGLRHAHILPLYDYGYERTHPYIVMKLVAGGTLADIVRGGPLPLQDVGGWLYQIASALDHAHAHGVVHRDLKPTNILLDGQGNAFLTDFGIAKLNTQTSSFTVTGNVLGTPTYMAPEQWRSEEPTPLTDVYGLGVLVYLMLTGQAPFEADTPHAMMYKHLNDPPPPMKNTIGNLPEAIQEVVKKALAKRPQQRYTKAGEFSNDYQRALRGQETLAQRESRHRQTNASAQGDSPSRPLVVPAPVQMPAPVYGNQTAGPSFSSPGNSAQSIAYSQPMPAIQPKPKRRRLVIACLALFLVGIVLTGSALAFTQVGDVSALRLPGLSLASDKATITPTILSPSPSRTPPPGQQPTLIINFPTSRSIQPSGSQVIIGFTATDAQGVTRIEVRRFGFTIDEMTLDTPQIAYTGSVVYIPRQAGRHIIELIPYRGNIRGDSAMVEIIAR